MQYLGLVGWIIALIIVVAWGQSFRRRSYDMVGARKIYLAISGILLAIAIGSLYFNGIKKGLDFTGGSIIEAGVYELKSVAEIRAVVESFQAEDYKLGGVGIQTGTEMVTDQRPEEGKPSEFQRVIIRLTTEDGVQLSPTQTRDVLDHLRAELGDLKELRTASIGPTISGELTNNAIKAVLLTLVLQLVYLFFRFGNQVRYGIAADIALVHDVVIMLGFYSLSGREIDSPFVAALLTVVGYSVMDSVVVFDRLRENLNDWWEANGEDAEVPYEELVNTSVNQTMLRSVNTTLTTLVTLLAIFYFGGSTLQNFAFALIVGIVAGAYSSVCVANPILVLINSKYPAKPVQASTWGNLDDEIVPEDFLEDDDVPVKPRKKPAAPILVEDDEPPTTGGRRRKRGKRS